MQDVQELVLYKTMTGWRYISTESLNRGTLEDIEVVGGDDGEPMPISEFHDSIIEVIGKLHENGRAPRHGDYYFVLISDTGGPPGVALLCRQCREKFVSIEGREKHGC